MELIRKANAVIDDPKRARHVLAKRASEYNRLVRERRLGLLLAKTIAGATGFHPYLWYLHQKGHDRTVTSVDDFRLLVDTEDTGIGPSLLVYSDREVTLSDRYTRLLEQLESPLVFDVGAHIGYYAVLAATKCQPSEVFAFEPAPGNYDLLTQNIALNDIESYVTTEQKAVTDENRSVELFLTDQSNTHSLRRETGETVIVDGTSLDAYCDQIGIDPGKVDVVRMDIEGAELAALRGMTGILADGPPAVCFVEVHPKYLTADDRKEIYETLEEHGYSVDLVISESVVSSPWPGPYDVSSFRDLESIERVHGVIAIQPDRIE